MKGRLKILEAGVYTVFVGFMGVNDAFIEIRVITDNQGNSTQVGEFSL